MFIFIWALSSQCHLPCWEGWDPSDLSDMEDINEAINNKLLSLLNPRSREGDGNQGAGSLWSLWHLLQSWPLGGQHGSSWQSEITSPGGSFMGEPLGWSNFNGCWVNRFTRGCPGPLTLTWQSVMTWTIAHQPSWIVLGSAARKAGFPTHAPTPVSKNAASLT